MPCLPSFFGGDGLIAFDISSTFLLLFQNDVRTFDITLGDVDSVEFVGDDKGLRHLRVPFGDLINCLLGSNSSSGQSGTTHVVDIVYEGLS